MRILNFKFILVLLAVFILNGCTDSKKTEEQYLADAKVKLEEKKYDEAIAEYKEFLKNYPKSDKAIFVYNEIAGIQISNLNNPQEGIKTYQELAKNFPDSKEAKQSLFMVAFIYDETLKDKPNAIVSYEAFLAKYPEDKDANDKMSESARTMLEVLRSGKTIEQIIEENISKSGTSTDSAGTSGSEESNNKIKKLESDSKDTKNADKKSDKSDDPAEK